MISINSETNVLVLSYFQKNKTLLANIETINSSIKKLSGLENFFESQAQANELLRQLKNNKSEILTTDRREFGDFQTNQILAQKVTECVYDQFNDIEFVLEPTCGQGNFLLAAITKFKKLKRVVGVEIYQPYVWETKINVLEYFLASKRKPVAKIEILHADAFKFSYEKLAESTIELKTLIIGNPPWVTNSELGSIASENLPEKSNFKKHSGFEAITGKGNFDIAEYISLIMLKCFDKHEGVFAFLVKNSVVKNIIHDQVHNMFRIGNSQALNIDSKKEFNVSVNACLFLTQLNNDPELTCSSLDFYTKQQITTYGWYKEKFVYSVKDYDASSVIDGKSKFVWRSGVKHDCSKIMELNADGSNFTNALGEKVSIEKDLLYGLLKSSDLKTLRTNSFRKFTIVTQSKIGEDTGYIMDELPKTYKYLNDHKEFFDKRKSSIYKDKPDFSIFGIGDYSFSPYKVAISGLYKSTHFTLVTPFRGKPLMLDDTCYFIGFKDLKMAEIAHYLVNSELIQKFLKSIIFPDSKRSINKDTLMRIDFQKAFENDKFENANIHIKDLRPEHWEKFGELASIDTRKSLSLF